MKKKEKKLEAELVVLRKFVEARFNELKADFKRMLDQARGTAAKPAPKAAAKAEPKKSPVRRGKAGQSAGPAPLLEALKGNKRGRELVKAGKARDQLLRSLIPLYLAQGLEGIEVNSGAISGFWKAQGVSFAGPNAAKALREHAGHATKSGRGWAITASGVDYVESALGKRAAA